MTKPGRIPCINPTCKRTASVEKHPDSDEIICGKCFKALPAELRAEHQRCWREMNKWRRRITRTSDEIRLHRMAMVLYRAHEHLMANWSKIREHVIEPDRPAGIDTFLSEMGMSVDIGERSD